MNVIFIVKEMAGKCVSECVGKFVDRFMYILHRIMFNLVTHPSNFKKVPGEI